MKHVALIGFMAAGKSTVGKKIARDVGIPFVDTDVLIEREHGSIESIFENEGEEKFREYELAAVARALESTAPSIVAVGGGAVTHAATRALLAARTTRVFLAVPEEEILARLRTSPVRPLLGAQPSVEAISTRYRERMPLYEQSDFVVHCGELDAMAVAQRVQQLLRSAGAL